MKEQRFNLEESVRRIPAWRKILYALLPVLCLLACMEIGARLWEHYSPTLPADFGLGFDENSRLFVPDPASPGRMTLNPAKAAFFNHQTFSMPKPEGTFRIAVLGESSVNFLQPQMFRLRKRLEWQNPKHKIEIINAGGCSYGSERLLLVTRELVQYDLDLLVIYMGNNEFEEITHRNLVDLKRLPLQRLLDQTALGRRARHLHGLRELKRYEQAGGSIDFLGFAIANSPFFSQIPKEAATERMKLFRDNLSQMVALAKESGIAVLMSTIPSNYWDATWYNQPLEEELELKSLKEQGEYAHYYELARARLSESPRVQASDAENDVIIEVARSASVPLVDMRAAIEQAEPHGIPGETLFADNCHLNLPGKRVWLKTMEPAIAALIR